MRATKTSHAALTGALVAASLAGLFAVGPFAAAVINSVIVEVQIAKAAHLPVPQLLPAALDGMGGLALVALAVLRSEDAPRTWLWALVCAALAASMAANGAHVAFPLDGAGLPKLPWYAVLGVAFVPPLSAAASAELILRIGTRVVELVRRVQAAAPAPAREAVPPPAAPRPPRVRAVAESVDAANPRVIELARAGRGYRAVCTATGWPRKRAEDALRAARAALEAGPARSTEAAA